MKGKKALLAGAIFVSSILAYNCGGGGGGTTPATSTTPVNVFVTDAFPEGLTVLEVTLYEINLCYDNGCIQKETVFSSPAGVPVDLTDLEGKLFYINTNNIPAGTYNAIEVITSDTGTVKYNNVTGTASFTLLQCQSGQCNFIIPANPPIDTTANSDIVIDFNLASNNTDIKCNIVKDANGQDVATCSINSLDVSVKTDIQQNNNQQTTPDTQMVYVYEVYGLLQNIDTNNNQITFSWAGKTYTGYIETGQEFPTRCEINDYYYKGTNCITNLEKYKNQSQSICLELELQGNPAQPEQPQRVIEFEITHPKKCGSQIGYEYEYEEYDNEMYVYDINDILNKTISVNNKQCSIAQDVHCEIDYQGEDKKFEGQACLDRLRELPPNNIKVEVKYRISQEGCEIYKIEVDDLNDD